MVEIEYSCRNQTSQDVTHQLVCCCTQLQKEAREKEETLQRMLSAEKKVRALEEDNRQLRREHSEMKKELDKMRKEVRYLKVLASSACLSGLHLLGTVTCFGERRHCQIQSALLFFFAYHEQ